MTTFNGNYSGSIAYDGFASRSASLDDDDSLAAVGQAFLQSEAGGSGSVTDNQPISEITRTIAGFRGFAGSGHDHWYYRFHIEPTSVDVGNILADTTETFVIWNGWLTAKTLSAITEDGDITGIAISPATEPKTFAGVEEVTYTLSVDVEGPSLVDLTYTFTFSTGEAIELPVTGQRIFAWTFRPNWSGGIEERLEWATDVMTSYNGTEQRFALRANPRRTMAYDFAIDNNSDRRKFEAMLFNWGARTWLVPIWMEEQVLAAQLSAGATSMTVPRMDGNWQEGGHMIIMTSAFTYEIVKIDSISGSTVNFNNPLGSTWGAGAVYYPAVTGILGDKQQLSRFTGSTEYGRCEFQIFEDETVGAASETTYRGLPVITEAPHWQSDITHDFIRKLKTVDYRLGKFAVEDEAGMPFNIISHHWTMDGKDEIDDFRAFVYARRGKQKACWLPTFTNDIELVENVGAASVYLDVAHGYIVQHLWGHKNRRDIRIELLDGTVFYRRLTDATVVSDTVERLTMSSALGQDITPDDVLRISWMSVARFDTDSISLQWKHDDWVDCSVNWRTVRDDV